MINDERSFDSRNIDELRVAVFFSDFFVVRIKTPCDYCEGAGWVKSPQTVCFEILEEARRLAKTVNDVRQTTLRVHPDVAKSLYEAERMVLQEIEDYLGNVDITGDKTIHQEQFDFAFI